MLLAAFVALWACASPVSAAATPANASDSSSGDSWSFDPHLDLRFNEVIYPDNVSGVVNQFFEVGNLQAPVELKYGNTWTFKVRPELQMDPGNNSISERYWAELPEGYLQISPLDGGASTLRFQLGMNTFTWGVTDGYNPLDVVSAARYEDPLFPDKLGAPSLAVHVEAPGGVVSLDGIYIPRQRQSILPGNNSRWLPREQFQSQSVNYGGQLSTIVLPPGVDFDYTQDQVLSNALDSNFGFKAEAHLPSLDLSAVFFDGAAPLPVTDVGLSGTVVEVSPMTVIDADSLVRIRPVYYRQIVSGGSFVYALGEFIIRGEAAFTRVVSKRSDLPSLANEYVGEIEHTFPIGDSGSLTAFLEGSYAQHSESVDPSLASLSRVFDRAVAVGAHYSPNSTLTASVFALDDTEFYSQLMRFELSDALTDALHVTGTGEILVGPDGSPVGTYRYNSRAILALKYSL
jgi:hypothetical protein